MLHKSILSLFFTWDGQQKTFIVVPLCLLVSVDSKECGDQEENQDDPNHTYLKLRKYYRISMNLIDVSGLVSSILICLMFVPEITHVYKNKDAKAINYTFLHLNLLASVLALVYSIHYNIIPMTITNISAAIFSLVLYQFKYVNELKGEPHTIDEVEV